MPLLEMRDIVKEFPGVRALDGVSLSHEAGEFHSLVGENGAGKSTLMKGLSGVYPEGSFEGVIRVDESERHFGGIRDSENAGIAIIFQELSLVKELNVGENIFLGKEPACFGVINWSELYHKAARLLQDLHLPIDARVKVTNSTTFGSYLYAIGGNADAARLSGINNKRNILKVYAVLGALTGVAALIFYCSCRKSRTGRRCPQGTRPHRCLRHWWSIAYGWSRNDLWRVLGSPYHGEP